MRNKIGKTSVIVVLSLVLLMLLSSCKRTDTISDKTPLDVVQATVYAYQEQDDEILQKCYGISAEELLKNEEINFEKKFFLSTDTKKIKINGVEELFTEGKYTYTGIYFDFITNDGQTIPYYEELLAKKVRNKQYQIVTKADYPRVVIDEIEANYEQMKKSEIRVAYEEKERKYAKGQPAYADNIHEKLTQLLRGMTTEMEVNLRFVGIIFLMAIVELGLLLGATYYQFKSHKKRRRIKDRAFRRT